MGSFIYRSRSSLYVVRVPTHRPCPPRQADAAVLALPAVAFHGDPACVALGAAQRGHDSRPRLPATSHDRSRHRPLLWRTRSEPHSRQTSAPVLPHVVRERARGCWARRLLPCHLNPSLTQSRTVHATHSRTHHATLATFILTFFLGEAFSFWKRTLCHARVVQRTIAGA